MNMEAASRVSQATRNASENLEGKPEPAPSLLEACHSQAEPEHPGRQEGILDSHSHPHRSCHRGMEASRPLGGTGPRGPKAPWAAEGRHQCRLPLQPQPRERQAAAEGPLPARDAMAPLGTGRQGPGGRSDQPDPREPTCLPSMAEQSESDRRPGRKTTRQ